MSLEFLERDLFKSAEGISYEEITKEFLQGGKNIPFKTEIDNPVAFSVLETFATELFNQTRSYYGEKEAARLQRNLKAYITGQWSEIVMGRTALDLVLTFLMALKINMISKERLSRKEVSDILKSKVQEEKEDTLSKLMERLG